MSINKKQFDVLDAFIEDQGCFKKLNGYSKEEIEKIKQELEQLGFIKDNKITAQGTEAMEPYKVKRAVFIAAGFGSRMVPVTLNTPKPLVRVNGTRIIDTLLDAVVAAGIEEIIIVRGYLAEQFDQLLYKYPMIKFVENPKYNEANNISSALKVKDMLSNAYMFEADLYLKNPELIRRYHYRSNFLGIKMERSDDWCFTVNDNIISSVKVGGRFCFQEVGISYWDDTDGKKLSRHIEEVFAMPGGKECYWEQVPLVHFIDEYAVEVRECKIEDIIEIDSFNELKSIDKAYDV